MVKNSSQQISGFHMVERGWGGGGGGGDDGSGLRNEEFGDRSSRWPNRSKSIQTQQFLAFSVCSPLFN